MSKNKPNNDMHMIIHVGIRISKEAKKKIDELAKKNLRTTSKEIERLIMEAE